LGIFFLILEPLKLLFILKVMYSTQLNYEKDCIHNRLGIIY
jgi:hypothetical protein